MPLWAVGCMPEGVVAKLIHGEDIQAMILSQNKRLF
jgi:hypothetical protein